MNPTTLATLIAALATFITALTALIKIFRTGGKLDNVEKLVNGNHSVALARIDQLGDSLTSAGVAIPDEPNAKEGNGNAV